MILIKRIKSMITIMLNLTSKRQHSNFVFLMILVQKDARAWREAISRL